VKVPLYAGAQTGLSACFHQALDFLRRHFALLGDFQATPDGDSLFLGGQAVEPQAALGVAVLGDLAKRQRGLDRGPLARGPSIVTDSIGGNHD
jgi:hypothetical protein